MAKISQILENFGKIADKFFGQNFLDIILGHFMETAWIVGPLRQAKRIFFMNTFKTNPLLISTGFLKYPLELKKNSVRTEKKFQL